MLCCVSQLPIDVNSNPANFEEFSTLSEPEQFRQVISSLDVKSTMKAFDAALEEKSDERNGENVNEDTRFHVIRRVVQLLLNAASDGHIDANTELGQTFEVVGDYEEASQWYEVAVDGGCLRAKNFLAMLHFTGKGVPCKLETAHEMFYDAARGGNSSAYNNIGLCFERGYGTDLDNDKAMELYLKGALLGSPHSMYSLGFVNVKQALSKDISASSVVTHRRKKNNGFENVRSTAEAVALVRHVTTGEGSDYAASDDTGTRERLMRSGVRWLRRAAELSVAEAGYQLGLLYEQGTGLPRDSTAAYEQFLWAAERGNQRASLHAARMLYDEARNLEESSTVDDEQALEKCRDRYNAAAVLFRYAAEYGIPEAMNSLGLMLEDGSAKIDGRPDHAEAAKWYLAAAGAGSIEAAGNLALLLAAKGEGFDFPDSGLVTTSGHRFTSLELEAWLDSLAQKATGNPRAQWLRDAVARLSGRAVHRQYTKRNSSPERANHNRSDHIPRIMVTNATPTRRKVLPEEPLFNASPAFSKRQEHLSHSMHVGGSDKYAPMQRSSDIDNTRIHREPIEVVTQRPEVQQMNVREPVSTVYAKSRYPDDAEYHKTGTELCKKDVPLESDRAAQVSDPSANWGRRRAQHQDDDMVSFRDEDE